MITWQMAERIQLRICRYIKFKSYNNTACDIYVCIYIYIGIDIDYRYRDRKREIEIKIEI